MNNNITEDFVSFEVAKLLKEKGFNVLVPQGYDTNELEYEKYDLPKGIQFGISSNTGKENFVTAPTHALAIKWIKENIDFTDIWVEPYFSKEPKLYTPCIWHRGDYTRLKNEISFQLANESALLYTLQNLIK